MSVGRLVRFLVSLVFTILFLLFLNGSLAKVPLIGNLVKNSQIPPIGQFLNPFGGCWQNIGMNSFTAEKANFKELKAPAQILLDERLVPHIFAQNDHDLYFLQGYITAKHRLWQMEFQTHAAAGRLSEILGSNLLNYDKQRRRIGMVYGAEKALKSLESDPTSKEIVHAYADGVNAYIKSLRPKDYPIEYKLLGYSPEEWTPLKTALLSKSMADNLTGNESDLRNSNALKLFGQERFDKLYPDFPSGLDPVIPEGTPWDFSPIPIPTADSTQQTTPTATSFISTPLPDHSEKKHLGSNNWAVSGQKTASGSPILCSDPHLGLSLPAIWFELQLHSPTVNVYGVGLAGAPGVIIGFNEHIAWGVTNATRDVKDWYQMEFKDKQQKEYKSDGNWKKTRQRIEEIKVKNAATVYDTVTYTHIGPIVYDMDAENEKKGMALRWVAHDSSNEMLAFYHLNHAKNYEEFVNALTYYDCPGQNFVYASQEGDIAIWHQGKFPLRRADQGQLLMDGTQSINEWQGFIPQEHNPHIFNPITGFVGSANQHPTAKDYPYIYHNNGFEYYRNRRMNQQLSTLDSITVEDMMRLQNDSYNLTAAEVLPSLLSYLQTDGIDNEEHGAYQALKQWNYFNLAEQIAPSLFELFWDKLYDYLWDEISTASMSLPYPDEYITTQLLITEPENEFMDIQKTMDKRETAGDLVRLAFKDAVKEMAEKDSTAMEWGNFRGTSIRHLARIPALSRMNLPSNGSYNILNASTKYSGPSWRMIVAFGKPLKAWGVYPGGQSGNPASPHYDDMVDKWLKGEYHPLHLLKSAEDRPEGTNFVIQEFGTK